MPARRLADRQSSQAEPVMRVARFQLDVEIGQRLELGQHLLDRPTEQVPLGEPVMEAIRALRSDFRTWDEYNERLLRSRFTTPKVADEYKRVTAGAFGELPASRELYYAREDIRTQMRKLSSIRAQLELYDSEVAEDGENTSTTEAAIGSKIFVVHGHDGDVKFQVADFLERLTGERPVILHEMADSGRTIIEKFEDYASEAGFAVVLLTADDVGGAKGASNLNSRARQNVVLELGFFYGSLGRGRVVALYDEGVEIPSDIMGVLYKPLSGNWLTALAKELRAAGIDIDPGKLF